ncbi:hypothetical protein Tco_0880271 [Tanacetum coccineum]
MSSSTVTYTSLYTNFEPWIFQWVSDDEPEAPQSPGQTPPSPDYVPGVEHPPSLDYTPIEDQPLLDDASPIALSLGYVADFDPEDDLKEDTEEDPAKGGDDDDDDESSDDDDDDADEGQEASEDDNEEEEEHPALTDSSDVPTYDPTLIATVAAALPLSPPPSLLTLLSSPLPYIPSPPLPLPSPPTHTIPTYAEALLGYRAAGIRLRAASPSTHHPSKIPSPPLFEVGESSSAAVRQAGHTLAHTLDYGFLNTMDANIRVAKSRAMTAMGVVNRRVTNIRGDTLARWLLLTSIRLLLPDKYGLTLREGARPWRPKLELCRGMSMYYRGRGSEMRTD